MDLLVIKQQAEKEYQEELFHEAVEKIKSRENLANYKNIDNIKPAHQVHAQIITLKS